MIKFLTYYYEVFIGVEVYKDFMLFLTMSLNIFVHLIYLLSEIYGQIPFLVQCGKFRLLQLNPRLSQLFKAFLLGSEKFFTFCFQIFTLNTKGAYKCLKSLIFLSVLIFSWCTNSNATSNACYFSLT